MGANISKMPESNHFIVFYAEKGQDPLSNFTFLCTVFMKNKLIF